MMQNIFKHSQKQQPQLGTVAYWSLFANVSSDRNSEITIRVREGDGYA